MSSIATEVRLLDPGAPEPSRLPAGLTRKRIAIGAVVLWILSGTYIVRPEQQAVITRFGAVVEPRVYPGLHYALPWPIDRVAKVKVNELQRLVIGGDPADSVLGRTNPLASQFLTGDENIINMRVVVQYFVGVPVNFLFRSQDVAKLTGAAVETELAQRVARRGVDEVLTTERIAIQDEVLAAAQRLLDAYGAGVKLSTVNIDNASPPAEAADAFRDVTSARADTERIVNEAYGYANDLIPRARGEATQLTESAEAYRQSKVNDAMGDAARFNAISAEYEKAKQVTGERLYLETMEAILPKVKKLVVDSHSNIDLTIIGKKP